MALAMSSHAELERVSTVDALANALRRRILDGDLATGERLVERELTERYGVARHSLRAALRALAGEGLVELEPNRGARVATLSRDGLLELFELRAALELEAAHLMLERNRGRVPPAVRAAVEQLRAVCEQADPPWSDVVAAHDRVHGALVDAAHSPRISRAYAALAGEMHLFVVQLKPSWTLSRMAEHHERLLDELETEGPQALRRHLRDGAQTVLESRA
jgi:DNA-binding GntR family transcriptional regulator